MERQRQYCEHEIYRKNSKQSTSTKRPRDLEEKEEKRSLLPQEQKPRSRCRSSDEECPVEAKYHN